MTPGSPLPPEVWNALPVEARALIEAMRLQIESLSQQVHVLRDEVRSLKGQLQTNSRNSSKPPSTDPLHFKRQPPKPPSGKKRGGQPGHQRATRPLVPPQQLADTITCKPTACTGCGCALDGTDPTPHRHQVAEIPPVRPTVIEYQVHRLACPGCGVVTSGPLPEGVPAGSFGPHLQATLSLWAAEFRLAKRPVQRLARSAYGLDISLGMIAKLEGQTATVLEPVDTELAEAVRLDPLVHVDETPWRVAGAKAYLWLAQSERATHLRISPHRDADTARAMLGDDPEKTVICDRYSGYTWVPKKQWCWAHLRRDFQRMIDRADDGTAVGRRLLRHSDHLFWAWHRVAEGEMDWEEFLWWAGRLGAQLRADLEVGRTCGSEKTRGTCGQLLRGWEHLWRFLAGDGTEPTNNRAERGLRHAVLWRRTSGGTVSELGGQFVCRLMSVVATCRQQGRSVLAYLTSCIEARLRSQPVPSLLGS